VKKLILLCVFFFTVGFFVTFQEANAVTITATPKSPSFGPNDWIIINLNIQGYNGGPITWVAHRPNNSIISGTIYQIHAGSASHVIIRDAYDNYFGTWSIDYMYNGVKQTVSFQVNPIILTVLTDKELYFETDTMKINITSSYYVPVAVHAALYYLNFYDKNGNPITYLPAIEIRALQPTISFSYPVSELTKYNPPGLYKLRVQYFNKIVEVPFLLGEYHKYLEISSQTDKASYKVGEDVNFDLIFTIIPESKGILKITDPSGNTTSYPFNVESVHTSLIFKDITNKIGIYGYEVQYAKISNRGSFSVVPNPTQLPNIKLGIFLDKLNYRPGEIIHAKVHTSDILTNSIAIWTVDQYGTVHQKLSFPLTTNDTILPYKVSKNEFQGQNQLYVNYDGIIKSVLFYVKGDSVDDNEFLNMNQFNIPIFVSMFGSSNFSKPSGIAIDSNGYIYVADSGNSKIDKFDSDGRLLLSWGSYGSEKGQFIHPSGIAVGKKYIYVADTGNARIQMFDKNGNFVYAWGEYGDERGMFHVPVSMSLDQSGDLFVADSGRNTIQIFDTGDVYANEIRPLLTEGGNFTSTSGIVFDSQNNFYASAIDNKILKFSDSADFINFYGSPGIEDGRFNNPTAIAVDSKGNFYVADTDNHRIQKFDQNGNFILSWGLEGNSAGQFEQPVGLAIDSSDNIYVVDKDNNNIQKFALYGSGKTVEPRWVKNNAMLWSQSGLDMNDFAQAIRYFVNQGLIQNIATNQTSAIKIPFWVKADAAWWAYGKIDAYTFTQTIQYLISTGIVKV
jgi:sugar lactone lactonase YvrE